MSDRYPVRDPLVHISDPPEIQLTYVAKQRQGGNEVVFWLAIKHAALIQWHKWKKTTPALVYTDLLNSLIPGHVFRISRESARIESRLSNRCSAASTLQQTLNRKGCSSQRKEHEDKFYKLAVLKNEIISVEKWEAEINSIQSKLKTAEEEICNWRKKYENLEQEKEKLVEEMLSEIENNNVEEQEKTKELEKENQQLIKYIDMLENESLGIHRGAGIPELKTKQAQNRKLKQLKTRAQKALHFVQIFGLDLQLLKLKEPNGNQTFSINFNTSDNTSTAQQESHGKSKYETLHPDDKNTVESILFLMDKFGVGDEFVHELSMAVEDFPIKSYLIKQCRSELNKQVKITTTPGLAPGAQHSFKELLADKVREMVSTITVKALLSPQGGAYLILGLKKGGGGGGAY